MSTCAISRLMLNCGIPVFSHLHRKIDVDSFNVCETDQSRIKRLSERIKEGNSLLKSIFTELSPYSRLLKSAERNRKINRIVTVDPDGSRFYLPRISYCASDVTSKHRCSQSTEAD